MNNCIVTHLIHNWVTQSWKIKPTTLRVGPVVLQFSFLPVTRLVCPVSGRKARLEIGPLRLGVQYAFEGWQHSLFLVEVTLILYMLPHSHVCNLSQMDTNPKFISKWTFSEPSAKILFFELKHRSYIFTIPPIDSPQCFEKSTQQKMLSLCLMHQSDDCKTKCCLCFSTKVLDISL